VRLGSVDSGFNVSRDTVGRPGVLVRMKARTRKSRRVTVYLEARRKTPRFRQTSEASEAKSRVKRVVAFSRGDAKPRSSNRERTEFPNNAASP